MTAQPDHATEAAELLACDRADVAIAHALLAIHQQLAAISRAMPRPYAVQGNDLRADIRPPAHPGWYMPEPRQVAIRGGRLTTSVADDLRTQVANLHRPAPDCGKGFVECIQTLEANRIDPSDSGRYASGWNGAMDAIRDSLLAHGYTASDEQEEDR